MTQLVDDEIVLELLREKEDFVVKVEVAALARAAPATFGVFDKHLFVLVAVKGVKERESRVY